MKVADIEVTYINHCGDDLSTVNAARVSFDKESSWDNEEDRLKSSSINDLSIMTEQDPNWTGYLKEQDVKLINYLAKHKHLSPFNHAFISVRVKAPIFVARQLVKHEYLPWNEVSRRYVDSEPEFYVPHTYRLRADNVKQGSSNSITERFINPWGSKECKINDVHLQHVDACFILYQSLLDQGICPEQARMVLPQNTMTEWIWSGTLGAFAKMLGLRLEEHTQKETRDVAFKVRDIVEPLFPVSLNALLGTYE